MARKRGSLNRRTAEVAAVLNRLEKSSRINPEKWILALDSIALDTEQDPLARIAAIRVLAAYRWGFPRAALDLKTTHELGEHYLELLLRIQGSDEHRRHLEDLERRRRRMAAVTVPALPEETAPEVQCG